MIAAYIRVSTRGQDLRSQQTAIQQASRARGMPVQCWYSEKLSGSTNDRPTLRQLRDDAAAGKVQTLFVYRLDRLSRAGIRDTLALVDELQHNGCKIESVADGFSLCGPAAEVVLAVLSWAAQMERQAIGDRIAAAKIAATAAGRSWGRPRRADELLVARVRAMALHWPPGGPKPTIRQISIALKVPRSTVAAILSEKPPYHRRLPGLVKTALSSLPPPPSE